MPPSVTISLEITRRRGPDRSCHVGDLPLARFAADIDLERIAALAAEHGAADRRRRGHDRQEAVAAGAGQLDAGADGGEEERPALVAVLDLDDGADGVAGARGEGAGAEALEQRQ